MNKLNKIKLHIFPLEEEFIDRLSYQFSTIFLLIIIGVVGIIQYLDQNIQCWTPQEFTKAWDKFSENYCYSLGIYYNTVYDNYKDNFPNKIPIISNHQRTYNMLAIQALLIFINYALWRLLTLKSELNLQRIMHVAKESNFIVPVQFQKTIKFIANHMDKGLNIKKGGCCARNSASYLSFLYIIMKILYLLNVVGQLYLMQKFIGTNYSFYGVQALYGAIKSEKWSNSANFPNNIICNIEILKLGRKYQYSLQCVLPINIFLEKVFIFLWFWFFIIGCISTISLIRWLNKLLNKNHRIRFIKEYLQLMEFKNNVEESCEHKFIFDYLKRDGFLIITSISNNISDMVAADVICNLWNLYYNKNRNECENFQTNEEPDLSEIKLVNINQD